jgi:hypothetical protein
MTLRLGKPQFFRNRFKECQSHDTIEHHQATNRFVPVQRKRHFPGTGVHVRIIDRGFVLNRVFVNPREAFKRVSGLALRNTSQPSRCDIGRDPTLPIAVGGVHNQRVTLPVASRVSAPRPEVGTEMGAPGHIDPGTPRVIQRSQGP